MLRHKYTDYFILGFLLVLVLVVGVLYFAEDIGIQSIYKDPDYVTKLFDQSKVHLVEIEAEDWDTLLENALDEEYIPATITIDGETFYQVGLRTKGNNSLRLTHRYGHDRYSLKLEFDHYQPGSYHGLDKFNLDAHFQDNSYLKSFIAFNSFQFMEVPSSLTSFTWVKVNGEDYGLFLAQEEPEEGFARRNFGKSHGELYKPAYRSLQADNRDVYLQYKDDEIASYDNIFRKAKFNPTKKDKTRLIDSLKTLSTGEDLETVVNIDEVLRYFVVQSFVVNLDSYLGKNGHNYFLYEEEGILSMIPWDYNLAFGTYALGMPNPTNDITILINYPISTPGDGEYMLNRPMFHHLMKHPDYFKRYHELYDSFIKEYIESGHFEELFEETITLIDPYVKKDPTAFMSYEDHVLGRETFKEFVLLRAKSVRAQLKGDISDTMKKQRESNIRVLGDHLKLEDLGEIDDLKDDGYPHREVE